MANAEIVCITRMEIIVKSASLAFLETHQITNANVRVSYFLNILLWNSFLKLFDFKRAIVILMEQKIIRRKTATRSLVNVYVCLMLSVNSAIAVKLIISA